MSDIQKQRQEARDHLMTFAVEWFAEWNKQDLSDLSEELAKDSREWLRKYHELLGDPGEPTEPGAPLLSIFSRVKPEGEAEPPQRYWPAEPLSLKTPAYPVEKEQALADAGLWDGFKADWAKLPQSGRGHRFEAFTHLLHRWAWAVPCSYGEPGVSLYDEFRALSALVHASGCAPAPATDFLLVGGDIPGIQDFVYTITSKGAAKGLRGRSVFIQLLGDAVVRRLLADLDLPETNVIYAAGGNFMLLAPEGCGDTAREALYRVNARLVEAIQGDTALVLAAVPVQAADLSTPGLCADAFEKVGSEISKAKLQPLREQAGDWAALFEPAGQGSSLSCVVCRIEVDARNSRLLEPTGEEPDSGAPATAPQRICNLCSSLGELASDIRHENLWLSVDQVPAKLGTSCQPEDGWTELLERMTGLRYQLLDRKPESATGTLALNEPRFLEAGASGFRLLANVTPQTTSSDIQYLRDKPARADEGIPAPGQIRSFALLAHAAATAGALDRVGVLRMDVDNLGSTVSQGIPDLSLPSMSALSRMLTTFFNGYFAHLVRQQADNELYIIYAGGDDLFVVGAWHHLPELAEATQEKFAAFTGDNPALTLSGGITLESPRFPLYRAAERAGQAEARAKGHTRDDGPGKDAVCFLDTVVGWEDWALVRSQKDELLWLIGEDRENRSRKVEERKKRLPRGLLHTIQSIYQLYSSGLHEARMNTRDRNRGRPADKKLPLPRRRMYFGRWVWMRVYSLSRLADRSKGHMPDAQTRIEKLQQQIMQPATVEFSGLSARWAEYLSRKEVN